MTLMTELKRRNVFKVAVAYVVVGWVVLQVADTITPYMNLPDWAGSTVLFFLIVGFPISIFFSWVYELTPEGLKKQKDIDRDVSITVDTGRKIDFIIIGALVLALGGVVYDSYISKPTTNDASIGDVAEQVNNSPSIAVLAFADFSPNKDQEYFADGISDEILNLLVKTNAMTVTGRTSSFSFKNKDDDIPSIATKLKVDNVLEGSISKSGNQLKITAQLNNSDGVHLWSETYKRELTDIFEIQEEIAGAIIRELKVHLLEGDTGPKATTTTNMVSLDYYLKGHQSFAVNSFEGYAEGRANFEKAIELDPNFTLAKIFHAYVIAAQVNTGSIAREPNLSIAKTIIEDILIEHPSSSKAIMVLGFIASTEVNYPEALSLYEKAKKMGENSVSFYRMYGRSLARMGQLEKGLDTLRYAIKLDPLDGMNYWILAVGYHRNGEIEKSLEAFLKGGAIAPEIPETWSYLANLYEEDIGDFISSIKARKKAVKASPTDPEMYNGLIEAYTAIGNYEKAEEWFQKGMEFGANTGLTNLAKVKLLIIEGNLDAAVTLIEKIMADPTMVHRGDSNVNLGKLLAYIKMAKGDLTGTEAFLHAAIPKFKSIGKAPEEPTLDKMRALNINWQAIVLMAEIFRRTDRQQEADNLVAHMGFVSEAFVLETERKHLIGEDYYELAMVNTLRGNKGLALIQIEKAVSQGYLWGWQIDFEFNPAFYSLREEPRYIAVLAAIKTKMARQKAVQKKIDEEELGSSIK